MADSSDEESSWLCVLKEIVHDILIGVAIVCVLGVMLFAVTGVWPPMVSVESGSMEPVLERGDLVLVFDSGAGEDVVTAAEAVRQSDAGESRLGQGDVVVYQPEGGGVDSLVIHRAMFYVEEGEDWTSRGDPEYMSSLNCEVVTNCPAPHAGFITKGDANEYYDQDAGISEPVKKAWVVSVGKYKLPHLGNVRLLVA